MSGANETWRGTWRADGNRRARLDIDRMGRDEVNGSGTVDLDSRGSFDRVELNGSGDGTDFSLDFRTTGRSEIDEPDTPARSPVENAAFDAVLRELRSRYGRGVRMSITTSSTRLSPPNEQVVMGNGHVYVDGRRRNFTYDVKVAPSTLTTHDVNVIVP
jgi:hypothetical protein